MFFLFLKSKNPKQTKKKYHLIELGPFWIKYLALWLWVQTLRSVAWCWWLFEFSKIFACPTLTADSYVCVETTVLQAGQWCAIYSFSYAKHMTFFQMVQIRWLHHKYNSFNMETKILIQLHCDIPPDMQ